MFQLSEEEKAVACPAFILAGWCTEDSCKEEIGRHSTELYCTVLYCTVDSGFLTSQTFSNSKDFIN